MRYALLDTQFIAGDNQLHSELQGQISKVLRTPHISTKRPFHKELAISLLKNLLEEHPITRGLYQEIDGFQFLDVKEMLLNPIMRLHKALRLYTNFNESGPMALLDHLEKLTLFDKAFIDFHRQCYRFLFHLRVENHFYCEREEDKMLCSGEKE